MNQLTATVVITTRNRKNDLHKAILSANDQSVPIELLVMDDASTDGTFEMVKAEFPNAIIVRSDYCKGLIVQRNMAAKLANGDVIFSLDDDAIFTQNDIVEKVLKLFAHKNVGAVAIPLVNIINGLPASYSVQARDLNHVWISNTYPGGAHAVRRNLFLLLGGYEERLFQWGEEPNFCVKLLNHGYVVQLASCGIIEHYPNPIGRHTRQKNIWIYRNSIINVWQHAPFIFLLYGWLQETVRWLLDGIMNPSKLPIIIEGLCRGYWWSFTHLDSRNPISKNVYSLYLFLKRNKCVALDKVLEKLPMITELPEQKL
jgi:glycosyltransferase involved in cell wall biosynthesis